MSSGGVEFIQRVLDAGGMWIILAKDTKEKRLENFGILFGVLLAVNIAYLYYLNMRDEADMITVGYMFIQTVMHAITLSLMAVDNASTDDNIDSIRKAYLSWIVFVIMAEPIMQIYATATADIEYVESSKRRSPRVSVRKELDMLRE